MRPSAPSLFGARVKAFPWHALASLTGDDARAAGWLRGGAGALVHVPSFAGALAEIVQARVELLVRGVATGGGAMGSGVGVLLGPADRPAEVVLVETEPALAASLAARVLRRKPPVVVDGAREPGEELAGGLAAILVAAARRAHVGTPLLVRGVGPAKTLAPALGPDVLVASFTVLVDDDAYLARAALPRAQALLAAPVPWSRAVLASLGETPLRLPVVAAATRSTAAEAASLRPGDVWLPGGWALGAPSAGLRGPVTLAAPGATEGVRATLGEGGRLVLLGGRVELSMHEDQTMNDAALDALGDTPVVVRVEIGAAELPAREWAQLGKGDVLALGTKVAAPVILRIGGAEVARGELVEIDGEVGVRIVSRRAPEPASPPTGPRG